MTIPTTVNTHWLDTVRTLCIEDLQGMHEDHDADFLAVQWSEIPSPTSAVASYPEIPDQHNSLLSRLIAWLLGPKP
jgi:hypothetical protein